ncbi:hypothetical protein [Microvirga sp. Mcv34]|uniref:hypothetical protein n=1 Tax=Microvirga sp. Mcv34 TaxID=2926016 RepID=UPI0021C58C3A|nr:hypothetical protein [Microvirga sp. Mcv34]
MERMKLACAAVALIGIGSDAIAQSHPLTTGMTCAEARGLLAAHGAIVLNTGPTTYERYVSSSGYCGINELSGPVWVPTQDIRLCPIGGRCVPVGRGDRS